MTERRSGRSRKTIDYAKFGENGDDDDDDFQSSKSQPEKRSRTSEEKSDKKKKKKMNDSKNDGSSQNSSQNSFSEQEKQSKRPSVDERVFQRQLKVVLERSVAEASNAFKNLQGNDDDFVTANKKAETVKKSSSAKKVEIVSDKPAAQEYSKGDGLQESDHFSAENKIMESLEKHIPAETDCGELACIQNSDGVVTKNKRKETTKKSTSITKAEVAAEKPLVSKSAMNDGSQSRECVVSSSKDTPIRKRTRQGQSHTDNVNVLESKGPDLSLISPVKKSSPGLLSSKGLRVGLSRKVPIKPLHPEVKITT